jgi:hypothetical protein
MPETLTLESCNFSGGKRLTISGSVSNDQVGMVYKFHDALKKYRLPDGQLLFDPMRGEVPTTRVLNPTTGPTSWTLMLELKRSETK